MCDDCTIAVKETARLEDSEAFPLSESLLVIAQGDRYYATTMVLPHAIAAFDRAGRLKAVHDKRGQGPGEFLRIGAIQPDGDSGVLALDLANSRFARFTRDLEVSEEGSLPVPVSHRGLARGAEGEYILAGPVAVDETVNVLHRVDREFRLLGSFAPVADGTQPIRIIGRGVDDDIWSVPYLTATLELWDPVTATLVRSLDYDPGWESQGSQADHVDAPPSDATPPRPAVLDVRQDGEGRLWLIERVPDARWRRAQITELSKRYDSRLVALDAETGRVVGRRTLDEFVVGWVGGSEICAVRLTALGEPVVTILEVRYTGPAH
jgi:hypothetical protein